MGIEEWRPVPGFEGAYEVSSFGRIRAARRRGSAGGLLKIGKRNGYPTVSLRKDGKYVSCSVHRLVALAFIENKNGYPCVNHKDETRDNNNVENLEWCSYSYNNTYGTVKERASKARYRPCIGTWPDGTKKQYNSCTLASKDTGISQGNIWGACNGLWNRAGGVKWRYVGVTESGVPEENFNDQQTSIEIRRQQMAYNAEPPEEGSDNA